MQRLYAFYVGKQASYECALDQIRDSFVLDVYANPPEDKVQLMQETTQALALFAAAVAAPARSGPTVDLAQASNRVSTTVCRVLSSYQNELGKDVQKLKGGLKNGVSSINQACLRIWQLLAEWTHIAEKQAAPKRYQNGLETSPCIGKSPMLQCVQHNDALAKLVAQAGAGWGNEMTLARGWYNQFVRENPLVKSCLARPISPGQDQQLLALLVEDIIFGQESIESFFSDLDSYWTLNKRIVKKLVRKGLAPQEDALEKGPSLGLLNLTADWEREHRFYTDLIATTLEKDEALEKIIAEKAKNWTLDRILPLDKTVLKLALCEMLYFADIPTKVSINEYIDLSKIYSVPKSSQFVNGLLDAVAADLQENKPTEA